MDGMRFNHYMEGCYDYTKELVITGDRSFVLRHHLLAFTALKGEVYNHNFFTLGKMEVGPSRRIDFPFKPDGNWRAPYDSVAFRGKGIRFSRKLEKGESVYTGDVQRAGAAGMPYEMRLSEGPLSISIRGDVPVTRTVLWANHRIACLEPYNSIDLRSGESFRWSIEYTFSHA